MPHTFIWEHCDTILCKYFADTIVTLEVSIEESFLSRPLKEDVYVRFFWTSEHSPHNPRKMRQSVLQFSPPVAICYNLTSVNTWNIHLIVSSYHWK